MYSFLYNIFFILKREEKRIKNEQGWKVRIIKWLVGYIEAYYNLFVVKLYKTFPTKKAGVTKKKRKQKIIISLTSFPKRIDTVWISIETLLRQSLKPDEIILWLAESQFNNGMESLPQKLLEQQERGLTIRFCDDLRSHKKYYYVMQEYPNDLVILVDDDTFYTKDLVRKLYQLHKRNPKDIVCMTPAMIYPELSAPPSGWRKSGVDEKIEHSFAAQPYTGQGTLYPPNSIPQKAFQKELIMEICPYADDLWLKFMSLVSNTPVTSIYKFRSIPVTIYGTGENGLWYINAQEGQNDAQWRKMLEYFEEDVLAIEGKGILCKK